MDQVPGGLLIPGKGSWQFLVQGRRGAGDSLQIHLSGQWKCQKRLVVSLSSLGTTGVKEASFRDSWQVSDLFWLVLFTYRCDKCQLCLTLHRLCPAESRRQRCWLMAEGVPGTCISQFWLFQSSPGQVTGLVLLTLLWFCFPLEVEPLVLLS